MKIEITKVTDWERVVDAARFTQRKESLGKEPSDEFKKQMILSEHSPLRLLEFDIKMYGIPYWVSNHFVRHVHAQPFVSTSRPDITGSKVSRHDMRQDDLVNLQLSLNAQEIINISKLRLCNKASEETREVWYKVLDKLACIEPLLASACVPQCVYRGFCPEQKSCGRDKKKNIFCYKKILQKSRIIHSTLTDNEKSKIYRKRICRWSLRVHHSLPIRHSRQVHPRTPDGR